MVLKEDLCACVLVFNGATTDHGAQVILALLIEASLETSGLQIFLTLPTVCKVPGSAAAGRTISASLPL